MKKKFYVFMSMLFCICFILMYRIQVQANDEEVYSEKNDFISYVTEAASEHISTMLEINKYVPNECDPDYPFELGKPFYSYYEDKGIKYDKNTLNVPVIQQDRVVLIMHVYINDDGTFSSGSSYDMVSIFDSYSDIYSGRIIYNKGWKLDQTSSADDIPLQIANAWSNTDTINLGYIHESQANAITVYRPNGFYVNDSTYKFLNMDNCLLLQTDATGTQRGLCWAATAGTIIRYVTGNRTINSYQIADEYGIGYDAGGYTTTIRSAMVRHGCSTQYTAVNRAARSITEVYHNINNQYPIAMVGTGVGVTPSLRVVGHAVTIVGYNSNVLITWNSASAQIETTTYHGTLTRFNMDGVTYFWTTSVLIEYNAQ